MSSGTELKMGQPRVVIPKLVFEKIMHMTLKGLADNKEVSGLGVTEIIGHDIIVRDVLMAKQKGYGASTDMEGEDVASLLYKFHQLYPELEPNFWWHTHPRMGVLWSSTDEATIRQIGGAGMCVATVFNEKRETRSAVASMEPFPFFIDNLTTVIEQPVIPLELQRSWNEEYDANVKKYQHSSNIGSGQNGGSFSDFNENDWVKDENTGCYIRKESKKGNENWDKNVPVKISDEQMDNLLKDRVEAMDDYEEERLWEELYKDIPYTASLRRERWEWAHTRDEVTNYDPLSDCYELMDGTIVHADMYMKKTIAMEGSGAQ